MLNCSHSWIQPVKQATHMSEARRSILDLFLVSPEIPLSRCEVLDFAMSDHLPIMLLLDWSSPSKPRETISRRSYEHFCQSSFSDDLSCVPWSVMDIFGDVDDKVFLFDCFFLDTLDRHAPLKTVRGKKHCGPWISKLIRKQMDKRDKLLKAYQVYCCPSVWQLIRPKEIRLFPCSVKPKGNTFTN